MDKLNLKEWLALVLTGIYGVGCFSLVVNNCESFSIMRIMHDVVSKFSLQNQAFDTLLLGTVLLIEGAAINQIGNIITNNRKSIRYKIYDAVSCSIFLPAGRIITENANLARLKDSIQQYALDNYGAEIWNNKQNRDEIAGKLFDKAYHTISTNDDFGGNVIQFRQAMYMFLRNIFIINIFAILLSFIVFFAGLIHYGKAMILIGIILSFTYAIIIPLAKAYRRMLMIALFSYYHEYVTKNNQQKNENK